MLVAEHQSFREAAELAHRSQSAISTQIKQLETQLGIALLHRTTRSVRLTTEGAELFAGTKRAMHEVGLGLRRIQEAVDIKRGKVALACSPTVASTQLPRILHAFEKEYPSVHIHLSELHSGDLFHVVRQGDVDFGIGPRQGSIGEDIHFETILDDPLVALMRKGTRPDKRRTISLRELATLPLLVHRAGAASRLILDEAQLAGGFKIDSKYECMQIQTLVAMAEAGLGTAIVPQSVVRGKQATTTKSLRIVDPHLTRQIAIITVRGRPLSPTAARLAQLFRELIDK
jgi:DNA-binding transcriptional LysR family regulator